MKRPTHAEALLQAAKIGLPPSEVTLFMQFWDDRKWTPKKGLIRDWRAAMQYWLLAYRSNRR